MTDEKMTDAEIAAKFRAVNKAIYEDDSNATAGAALAHASDCAVHNMPAFDVGRCDCGASK